MLCEKLEWSDFDGQPPAAFSMAMSVLDKSSALTSGICRKCCDPTETLFERCAAKYRKDIWPDAYPVDVIDTPKGVQ
jgi:hypothetical protein